MKVKDENEWKDLGGELTDFRVFGKTLIPFSKNAQKRFDSHPIMIQITNDRDAEVCFSLKGTEFYVSPKESVRVSVCLSEKISFVIGDRIYSKSILSQDLNNHKVFTSQFNQSGTLKSTSTLAIIIFVIIAVMVILYSINS